MKRPFAATVWREGKWFVSQCLDVDVASQGRTEEEALENLKEALELHFEPPRATRVAQALLPVWHSAASPQAFSGQLPIRDKFAGRASWMSFSEPEVPEVQRLSADG
jgi:predicted RNase H-like HicB family nuclease